EAADLRALANEAAEAACRVRRHGLAIVAFDRQQRGAVRDRLAAEQERFAHAHALYPGAVGGLEIANAQRAGVDLERGVPARDLAIGEPERTGRAGAEQQRAGR